jgi:hypothetical protein
MTMKTSIELLEDIASESESSSVKATIALAILQLEHAEVENQRLREALTAARQFCWKQGYTLRQFAAGCGSNVYQISEWTGKSELGEPDFVD